MTHTAGSVRDGVTRFFASRAGILAVGSFIGLIAVLLQKLGNPPNAGICVACFERDIAGAVGLHRARAVQYIRPEIIGFVMGALMAALLFGEFRPRGGSAPVVRLSPGFRNTEDEIRRAASAVRGIVSALDRPPGRRST